MKIKGASGEEYHVTGQGQGNYNVSPKYRITI